MDQKIIDNSKNEKRIEVTLYPEEIEKYGEKAAMKISSETEIKGFRPGKAPKSIVEETVGKERVWREACFEAMKESYSEAVEKNSFLVVSPPQIQFSKIELGKPFSFNITVSVLPKIDLPDYKKIAKEVLKEKKKSSADEKEIDRILDEVRKSRSKVKAVLREGKKNDQMIIDFQGLIEEVEQEDLKGEKVPVVIGDNKFIKGFDDHLIGLKAGEEKKFSLKMPMPKEDGSLAEKDVDFKVKVHSVNEMELPELNDEFARSLGNFSDLKDLKSKIKENTLLEKEHKEKERIRVKIIDKIMDKVPVEIPDDMTEKELDYMIKEFEEQLSRSGITFKDYLAKIKKTEEEIRKEWKKRARKRILMGLVLQEIAKKEGIKIEDHEIEKEANDYLNRIRDQKTETPDLEKLKLFVRDLLQNEKVFQILEK